MSTVAYTSSGGTTYSGKVTLDGDQVVLAYRCDQPCAVWSSTRNGGTTEYVFMTQGAAATVYYWVFDLPKYAQMFVSNAKQIVRRQSDGEKVFDSRNKYLKVQDFIQSSLGDQTISRSYAKYPGLVMVKRAWDYRQVMLQDQSRQILWVSSFAKTSGNTVETGARQYVAGSEKNPNIWYPSGASNRAVLMVIDLENY